MFRNIIAPKLGDSRNCTYCMNSRANQIAIVSLSRDRFCTPRARSTDRPAFVPLRHNIARSSPATQHYLSGSTACASLTGATIADLFSSPSLAIAHHYEKINQRCLSATNRLRFTLLGRQRVFFTSALANC